MRYLNIEYADPSNLSDSITVKFKLRNNSFVPLWVERVTTAQKDYVIDDPKRFYGFGSIEDQIEYALQEINKCIRIINNYDQIIDKKLNSISDYDTLNYLHHIFEVYHGLLDQQTHPFYINAPDAVKHALAQLNICVHRCESVSRGASPRHVVTYYGLPKTKKLSAEHFDLFTDIYNFGTVYLNYVEIGKTLEDLTIDNDQYIGEEAFKPFDFYSADFCVMYHDSNLSHVLDKRSKIKNYFNANASFFLDRGYYAGDPRLNPGRIPLADIDSHGREVLQLLERRQFVKSVYFN